MKNKNIRAVFCQHNLIRIKAPMQKCAKRQKIIKHSKIFLARFAHSAFYKIHTSGAATRHVPVLYANYVFFFFFLFFFFLSSHHDTKPFSSFVSFS